jgi:hypothetical protein
MGVPNWLCDATLATQPTGDLAYRVELRFHVGNPALDRTSARLALARFDERDSVLAEGQLFWLFVSVSKIGKAGRITVTFRSKKCPATANLPRLTPRRMQSPLSGHLW